MPGDPELTELFDQAARNLATLELLARSAREDDPAAITYLQARLQELKQAYTRETDVMSLGILYEVQGPSFIDQLSDIKTRARAKQAKEPTTDDIVRSFLPKM